MNMPAGNLVDANFRVLSTARLPEDAMPHGSSVRVRKLNTPGYTVAPNALYLVYVKLENDGRLTVRHMCVLDLINNSVADTEDDLFNKARAGGGAPEQVGSDFATLIFQRPTYFSIVLDNNEWDFYYPNPSAVIPVPNETHDPIVFIKQKVTMVEQPGGQPVRVLRQYEANTSFFDSESVQIGGRNAVRCINFFRDENGDDLDRYQDLGFEILVRVPFALSPGQARKLLLIIDPDGQNQGPST